MKKRLLSATIIGCFIVMLCFPRQVFEGASDGLLLWFKTVLPTLLPFMIITTLLIQTNIIFSIAHILAPVMTPLFGVSKAGCFPVLAGFLCGYPMGAKATADLVSTGHISVKEGQYLLSFCNNTSPMFIISFIVMQNLKNESLLVPTIVLTFLGPILCSFLFRFFYLDSKKHHDFPAPVDTTTKFSFQMLDTSIMNGFETITKVGGYIIIFSIAMTLLEQLPLDSLPGSTILLPMLEITRGTRMICRSDLPLSLMYPLLMFLTAFGGVCAAAQTQCMIKDSGIRINPYIIQKLITAGVTSLLAFAYILLA